MDGGFSCLDRGFVATLYLHVCRGGDVDLQGECSQRKVQRLRDMPWIESNGSECIPD